MINRFKIFSVLFLVISITALKAQSADEIIKKMETKLFPNCKALLSITFTNEKGEIERFSATTYALNRNQRIIVRFTAPSSMVGSDLLMIERTVWMYNSKTDRILQIPSNLSFGGTGFSYGDIMRLNFSDNFLAKVLSTEPQGGMILELSAKERDAPYFKIVMELDGEYNPIKGICYARSGDIVKEMVFSNIKDVGTGSKPLTITVTSPLEPGRISILTIVKETPKDYPEQIFNKRNLSARLEEKL